MVSLLSPLGRIVTVAALAGGTALVVPSAATAQTPPLQPSCASDGTTVTCVYGAAQSPATFVPPPGVTSVTVRALGAPGGRSGSGGGGPVPGGAGAEVSGSLNGLTGAPLTIVVGRAGQIGFLSQVPGQRAAGGTGFGNGGAGGTFNGTSGAVYTAGGAGGGGSAVLDDGTPLVVAGGGGGGGGGQPLGGGGLGGPGADSGQAPATPIRCASNPAPPRPGVLATPDGSAGATTIGTRGGATGGGGGGGRIGGEGGAVCNEVAAHGGAGGTSLVPPGGTLRDGVVEPNPIPDDPTNGTVEISYAAGTAPVAVDDDYRTTGRLDVAAPGVLGNDTLAGGAPLSATEASGPSNGMLTLDPDGSFVYQPDAGFTGIDSFTYRATAAGVPSAPATVRITVDAPAAPTQTSTALRVLAPSPAREGTPVPLVATVTRGLAGTVQFRDAGRPLGSAVPVNARTGVAVLTAVAADPGRHVITAEFVPTAGSRASSTSAAVTLEVVDGGPTGKLIERVLRARGLPPL